jgi:hypothetical protein
MIFWYMIHGWTWCTIQIIFMLCIVCVVTTIVVGANIGAHNTPHGDLTIVQSYVINILSRKHT